jgi:BirA family biotin operon repressor/biotin-[acetyl-CoA-carboxylase] ligase
MKLAETAFVEEMLRAVKSCGAPAEEKLSYFFYDTIDSTMNAAREVAPQLRPAVLLARAQTHGRGRGKHTWFSARDAGLYQTFVFDTATTPLLTALPLVMGCAVLNFADRYATCLELKWPNDIIASPGRGKLCGILTESFSQNVLSVGIGVNLRTSDALREVQGVALEELAAKMPSYACAFAELTREVYRAWTRFSIEGFEPFYKMCSSRLAFRGTPVATLYEGKEITAIVEGLGRDGSLLVRRASEELRLYGSEIRPVG